MADRERALDAGRCWNCGKSFELGAGQPLLSMHFIVLLGGFLCVGSLE